MNPSETVETERLFWSAMSRRRWVRDENVVVERADVDELISRRVGSHSCDWANTAGDRRARYPYYSDRVLLIISFRWSSA